LLRLVAAIAYTCALFLTAGCEIRVDIVDAGEADGGGPDGGPGQRCGAGEFDDDGRPQTPCIAYAVCQPGQYVSRDASPTDDRICSACKSGSFSTEINASACKLWTNCAPGTYSENSPSSTDDRSCKPCTDGSRTRGPNESICHPPAECSAGTVRNTTSDGPDCMVCSPGNYCSGGDAARESCEDGRWDHDANPATECVERTLCLAGQYVASEGDADNDRQCAACTSGHVSVDLNAQDCRPFSNCQPGEYISVAGSARIDRACSACAADSFSTTVDSTSCEFFRTCEAGSFVQAEGSSTRDRVCVGCASGSYNTEPNSYQCRTWSTCDPGTHVMNEPSASADRRCEACDNGTTTEGENWSVCVTQDQCAAGTFAVAPSDGDAPPECDVCLAGNFCAGANSIVILCEGGTWDHDADPATVCVTRSACLAGEYVTDDGNAVSDRTCSPCPDGTYTSSINERQCTAWTECPAGTYVSQMGGSLNDRICVACPARSFSAANNANSCTRHSDCLPGQFVSSGGDATSDRSCTGCSSGSFSALVNEPECVTWQTCEPGDYMTNTPSVMTDRACEDCAEGTFSEQPNQSSCTASGSCRPGSVEAVPGSASNDPTCEVCEAGTYCAGNQSQKVPCSTGSWDHDGNAATSCVSQTLCTSGQYVSVPGSPTEDRGCGSCEAGSFSPASNVAACAPWSTCAPGYSVSHAGDAKTDRACVPCAAGSFSTQDNSSACSAFRDCSAGQRVATDGTASSDRDCIDCGAGTYSSVANAVECSAWASCTAGRYASAPGTSSSNRVCIDCAAGSYSTEDNVTACQDWATCLPGTQVAQQGSTSSNRSCEACGPSSFSLANNTLSCTAWSECSDGTYVSKPGTSVTDRECSAWSDCLAGTYVTDSGSGSGNRSCRACEEGRFSTSTNASACAAWSDCDAGTYVSTSPNASRDRGCSSCPQGTFSANKNRDNCTSWKSCGSNEEISVPGSSTSDQQCGPVQAPPPNFLWLDATDASTITKDNANRVSLWRDKSGLERNAAVPGGSDPPLYRDNTGPGGTAEIEFSGGDVRLQTATVPTAPEMTVFVVFNLSSPQAWGSLLNQGHDMYYSVRISDDASGQLNWHVGDRDDAPLLAPNIGAYQLLTTLQGSGVASMYYHPTRVESTSEPNIIAGNAPITIGNAQSDMSSMGGTIAEIRAYNYVLSVAQRNAVEEQLKAKYNLGRTSCADILSHNSEARSGRYTIDPDGAGDAAPVTVICDMTDGGWMVISTEDFTNDSTGWNPSTRSSCGGLGDILGGIELFTQGTAAAKTYNFGGRPHTQVRLSLDYIKIGAWDNEDAVVTVDGATIFEQSFLASDGAMSYCGNDAPEHKEHIDMPLNHTANTLTVRATSTLADDDDSSEAFAIDNVVVRIK
jgi:hypothetical protein